MLFKEIEYNGLPLLVTPDGRIFSKERDVVYSDGRVYHYKSNELKQYVDRGGYLVARSSLNRKGINIKVHRAVAMAFLPNPNNLPEINHKDENKKRNFVWVNPDGSVDPDKSNLEWCSRKYNNNYGTKNERTAVTKGKKILCVETGEIYNSASEARRKFGSPSSTNIYDCLYHRQNTAYGYHWRYIE